MPHIGKLYRYFTRYNHIHDYVWSRLLLAGFFHNESYHCSTEINELKQFHDNITRYYGYGSHVLHLGDRLCDDESSDSLKQRTDFVMSLSMDGSRHGILADIYLLVKLTEKMMKDGREDLVNDVIQRFCHRIGLHIDQCKSM